MKLQISDESPSPQDSRGTWSPLRKNLSSFSMSIQGQILEVRVLGCSKLRDTEFFTRQDPYVCLEYAGTKFRTRTCTDGGRNPTFQEKFQIPLIEGQRELTVVVWNSNTFTRDDFIGSGVVQLHKVLTQGYDDSSWPLQARHMRPAGEVKLNLHFSVASSMKHKTAASSAATTTHSIPPTPAPALAVPYSAYSPSYPPAAAYPAAAAYPTYPTPSPAPYPTSAYPPQPLQQQYPPPTYPPAAYPPQQYPLPPSVQPPYPPAPYPGSYPPPY